MPPLVRPYSFGDSAATAALLYESSGGMYDRYAGNRALAERVLVRALEKPQTTASADVVRVAEIDGVVAGAMAAMSFAAWTPRAYAFLRVTLRTIPFWRWPRALRMYRLTGRTVPDPPRATLYVDSLAVFEPQRRRGAGRALLAEAERMAAEQGLRSVALDTWADNAPALALYRSVGFIEVARSPAAHGLPGGVSLLRELS